MSTPQASAAPGPALNGWVRVGQAAWIVAALLSVGLVAADYPYRFDQLRAYCLIVCEAGRLPPSEAPALARLGLTLDAYAAYTIALYLALTLVCWGMSVLLAWRKSGEGTALLAAVCLLALGPSTGLTLATVLPAWRPVFVVLILAGFVTLVYLFLLFPNGRFVPGWTRWSLLPFGVWLALGVGLTALHRSPPAVYWLVLTLLLLGIFALGGLAQIYRFTRLSSPTQRQQTKWVVAGFAVVIIYETLNTFYLDLFRPMVGQPALSGAVHEAASTALDVATLILIPLTLGIAIFRYRLWDIDLIIRRTLIYSLITVLLALAYFGSVLVLQAAFGALTGQSQSTLVTVLSTLVIAGLFVPVRGRVQTGIDRRFYRRRYDATRTLAAFGSGLRDDVELAALTEHLLGVVDETMQPNSVSLWIKPGESQAGRGAARGV